MPTSPSAAPLPNADLGHSATEYLKILILEDSEADAHLIRLHIEAAEIKAAFSFATNEAEFLESIETEDYDLILADYYLRGFDAITALHVLQERSIDVPVILVSGQIGEDVAVESLHAGATDYLLKDKLVRLGPAVRRALAEHRQQQHNRVIEAQMQRQANIMAKGEQVAQFGAFEIEVHEQMMYWTPGIYAILGLTPNTYQPAYEDIPKLLPSLSHLLDSAAKAQIIESSQTFSIVQEIETPQGQTKYCRFTGDIIQKEEKISLIGIAQDITKEYEAELALRRINDQLEERVEVRTRALQASEKKYRLITENMVDMVTLQDHDGMFTFVSPSVYSLVGYQPQEVINQYPERFIHQEDLEKLASRGRDIDSLKQPQIVRFKDKQGQYVWLETLTTGIYDDDETLIGLQTISRDISERKKAEEQTRIAIERERELTELRSNFVSIASHQFRTPLAVIRSNTQLLDLVCRAGIPKGKETLFDRSIGRIEGEINRLLELMDDILILGKHEAGQVKPRLERISIPDLLEELIEVEFSGHIDGRIPQLVVEADIPTIPVDPRLLSHAFSNLLTNALHYSPGQAPPVVRVSVEDEQLKVRIRDYGIGIPPEEIPHLFESFYRGNNVQDIKGTGLGLSIVDQFIRLNGGKVKVFSELNKGTEFVVSFDICQDHESGNT